jgi:hypothetical protein
MEIDRERGPPARSVLEQLHKASHPRMEAGGDLHKPRPLKEKLVSLQLSSSHVVDTGNSNLRVIVIGLIVALLYLSASIVWELLTGSRHRRPSRVNPIVAVVFVIGVTTAAVVVVVNRIL